MCYKLALHVPRAMVPNTTMHGGGGFLASVSWIPVPVPGGKHYQFTVEACCADCRCVVLLACVGGLTLLASACAFEGFLLVYAYPLLHLCVITHLQLTLHRHCPGAVLVHC